MSAANPIPELEGLSGRAFSFYPPILGIEHNEWRLQEATWSEILVHNTKDQNEIWVPRRFLGKVSAVDEPVMIVGLERELAQEPEQPHLDRTRRRIPHSRPDRQ